MLCCNFTYGPVIIFLPLYQYFVSYVAQIMQSNSSLQPACLFARFDNGAWLLHFPVTQEARELFSASPASGMETSPVEMFGRTIFPPTELSGKLGPSDATSGGGKDAQWSPCVR